MTLQLAVPEIKSAPWMRRHLLGLEVAPHHHQGVCESKRELHRVSQRGLVPRHTQTN